MSGKKSSIGWRQAESAPKPEGLGPAERKHRFGGSFFG